MDTALDPRLLVGRIFQDDWTIANVAKLLRFNAGQGMLRANAVSGAAAEMNQDYLRKTSARHLPTGVTVAFRRTGAMRWHADLCFAGREGYLPWNEHVAEEWLIALFGIERPFIREITSDLAFVRRFELTDAIQADKSAPGADRTPS